MTAHTAPQVHELFAKYFSAGDLDGLVSLYEPGATLVPQPGVVVSGQAGIREALSGFLALKGEFELQLRTAFQSGDIALLLSTWSLKGADENGAVVELSGQTADVVRQQANGTWLLVIDNPNGAESVQRQLTAKI